MPTDRDVAVPQAITDPGAVSITSSINQGRRIYNLSNGLKIGQVEIFLNNAATAMPTAGELSLPKAIWARMGFSNIIAIPEIPVIAGVGRLTVRGHALYDAQSAKILLNKPDGTTLANTDIGNGGSLRCLCFGF